jgi:hypothetical protein
MSEQAKVPTALRLVFERRGDEVVLINAIPLHKVVPPTDDLDVDDTQRAGFAVRLFAGDGSLVYRRAMADPLFREAEVWTGDPDHPWEIVAVDPSVPVRFDVIVPNSDDDEEEVELVASPPRRVRQGEAATRVARMKVRNGRYDQGGVQR